MSDKESLLNALRIERDSPATTANTRRFEKRLITLGVPALTIVLGLIYYWIRQETPAPPVTTSGVVTEAAANSMATNPATTSTSETSTSGAPGDRILSASGYITARRMATVAARITGLITAVVVEEGMAVKAGDVLARLDDSLVKVDLQLAQAQVKAADAQIDSVAAQLSEAKRALERVTSLKSTDFSSESSLTQARAEVERLTAMVASARADLDVARFQVDRQREQLDEHVIYAPFTGVVTDKNAQPGEVVSPMSAGGGFTRTGICTIVDMDSLEIEVDVNEAFIGRVSAGQGVVANLDAYPDWDVPARVIAIIPTANREKATVRVRIGLEVNDVRILPDMGVKVAFLKQAGDKTGS